MADYSVFKTDGTLAAIVTDNTINTTSLSISLVGRKIIDYGKNIAENQLHIMENFSNSVQPANAVTGQLWWDNSINVLKVFDGTIFSSVGMQNPSGGDFDAINKKIINVIDPVSPQDVATKNYVDTQISIVDSNNLNNIVEDLTPQLGGNLDAQTFQINNLADPILNADAATKNYVDTQISIVTSAPVIPDNNSVTFNKLDTTLQDTWNVGLKNALINGNFDIWQRGVVFNLTTGGYTADRWLYSVGTGNTSSISQQTFTVGQTNVPNEPKYYLRLDRTITGTGDTLLENRIEGVRTFAGETITLSFWVKASAPMIIDTLFNQHFGTGGSTDNLSAPISHNITTTWTKFTHTITLNNISGKTIGTSNDDYLSIIFNAPVSEGNFILDIAQVQLEKGSNATPFELRPIGIEHELAYRYFERRSSGSNFMLANGMNTTTAGESIGVLFFKEKRNTPTLTFSNIADFNVANNTGAFSTVTSLTFNSISNDTAQWKTAGGTSLTSGGGTFLILLAGTGFIDIDAEL